MNSEQNNQELSIFFSDLEHGKFQAQLMAQLRRAAQEARDSEGKVSVSFRFEFSPDKASTGLKVVRESRFSCKIEDTRHIERSQGSSIMYVDRDGGLTFLNPDQHQILTRDGEPVEDAA